MSSNNSGHHVSVYVPKAVYEILAAEAVAGGVPVSTAIRNRLMATFPESTRTDPAHIIRSKKRYVRAHTQKSHQATAQAKIQTAKPPTDGELVDHYRNSVLDLHRKGYTATAIAARLKVRYRVVDAIIASQKGSKRS